MQRVLLLLLAVATWDAWAASIPFDEGSDSLRGALEALDRRQRALQQRPQYVQRQHANRLPRDKKDNDGEDDSVELINDDGQPEDIGYGYQRERQPGKLSPEQLKQAMLAVLGDQDDEPDNEGEDYSDDEEKRGAPASMFRERNQQIKQHHRKRTSDSTAEEERKYRHLLAALWDKYQAEEQQEAKRQGGDYGYEGYDFYNSPMAWGSSHFDGVKRNYGYNEGYDMYNSPMAWGDGHFEGYKKRSAEDDPWYPAYNRLPNKRITLRKRSSSPPLHQETDEKTKAELAEIFDKKQPSNSVNHKQTPVTTVKPVASISTEKPQQKVIKKKSVDWSQYFGMDKRRSLDEMDDDERKMMERYYRTFALATTLKRKRSTPITVQSGDPKLDDMEHKLRVMEDLIVDEAVKYTGAHQGTDDPVDVKKVKDQVLKQLAAAYSLEKMRQGLAEFRSSLNENSEEKRSIRK
ncbi:probable serine/threonine-protein kinase kinX isoform X1 [Cloeon dipterum]|uniref:probable serine/threonine-protein kinase kinX isoform X1 n=2 Tax=Cloeon dipterum TaxID=197152 RepID=UPI00321FAEA7